MQNGGYGFSRRTLAANNTPGRVQQPGAQMSRFYGKAFLLMFVIGIAVLLYLFVSAFSILKIFLIALGVLCILWVVAELDDRMHIHKVRQKRREIMLGRFKRQQLPAQCGRHRRDEVLR
jgi:Na+/H+ antiporter NhaD/arsenite permease-like protein